MVFDLLLGDVHSLKQKRSVIRPLVADLSRRTEVAVAEVGDMDVHRRSQIGVSVVSADLAHVREVLERAERFVAEEHPEVTLLSARHGLHSSED
ncbi:hypothetical protein SAMN06298212_1106 [Ruaniaceae bacterium KH17]|nr:hypothetical protein SAMN06298212_1106 [Ruaniaceae bacterium KH17]